MLHDSVRAPLMEKGMPARDPTLDCFLREHALARPEERGSWIPLRGGVSSDIWRVDLPGRSLCVKRALSKLKVAVDWRAPISRNAYEWKWMCFAAEQLPRAVPHLLAHDAARGLFAMSFLPPEQYPVWKHQLFHGVVVPDIAAQVGVVLATLHNASANRPDLAKDFDSGENFWALRIEPYLLTTGDRHPDLTDRMRALAERTSATAIAVIHGDVSPKNILVGQYGPVFLDAECACYGDPAFDLAFCLNHLLLKLLVLPAFTDALLRSFLELAESYFCRVNFCSRQSLELRVADLLPALMLARVDGKSPVEYLNGRVRESDLVRRVSRALLKSPVASVAAVATTWSQEIKTQAARSSG